MIGSSRLLGPDFEPSTNLEAAIVRTAARDCHVTAVCGGESRQYSSRLGPPTKQEPTGPSPSLWHPMRLPKVILHGQGEDHAFVLGASRLCSGLLVWDVAWTPERSLNS